MEADLGEVDSCLDEFLNQVTTNVLRCAIEKLVEIGCCIDIEEEALLAQLNQDLHNDSHLNDTSAPIVDTDFQEISDDLQDIEQDAIYTKCCKLIDDTLADAYAEVKMIVESDKLAMASDIDASENRLRLLLCLKNSDRIQNLFQNISVNIIQDAMTRINGTVNNQKENHFEAMGNDEQYIKEESFYANVNSESDTLSNIDEKQGSDTLTSICQRDPTDLSTPQVSHHMAFTDDKTLSQNEPGVHYSTAESSFYSSMSKSENTDENLSNIAGFTTANSVMFTTANEQECCSGLDSSEGDFVGFDNGSELVRKDMADSTPRRNESEVEMDETITGLAGPRQSTPVGNDDCSHESPEIVFSVENFDTSLMDTSQMVVHGSEAVLKTEPELEVLSDEESSSYDPSSPRTLSRQSSTFGNVTLEFDHEAWESGIHGFHNDFKAGQKREEKHTVILHELSFDERADLKAPDLLGPVYLAVQDDDENEETRRKQKLSQSIDDLCEMISDSEEESDLPLRRRAMSLESKKPLGKTRRLKVPTKDELIRAFQELRNEIMEDEDEVLNDDVEEENVEMTSNERPEESDIEEEVTTCPVEDPLRWQTVVFNGQHKVIDLKILEPFLKVLTHGGYHCDDGKKAVIVVLTACNLPSKKLKRYPFIMEQLFFFLVSTMDILITSDEYIFVYFHGGADKNQSPSLSWLKKYYQYIDRRLRKSVTKVYVVHPNLWLKSVFRFCRPFLSSNFARKLKFVNSLKELSSYVKTDFIYIPDEVVRVDPDYKKVHAC